ncbi:LD-carboxypeptidase [Rossellomorea aquimaris]|uniref:S66 peptidase family protein n=1 Tax=Rossellomorea aquimaris TaxID=189382 RepID=UPI001CD2D11C|nr:LD-carboxypeptidase [Rossellomorea aquimaris]MCA1053859.1 LD-carboxypeptidase [Rossellomorea aquimaris]
MVIKAPMLKRGDTVGVIAPASPPKQELLRNALSFLQGLGLVVKMGSNVHHTYGYLAGKDDERLEDIHTMFRDQDVKAIICACGGYGTGRLATQLDYELIARNPKIFWGYSDITFLHTAIHQKTGLVTFHGPMLSSDIGLQDVDEKTKETFQQLFESKRLEFSQQTSPIQTIVDGKAEGPVIGGNLTLLVSTLGTPYEVDTRGRILFIEEIDEEPYKVDRMLNQLMMAGKFKEAEGIIVGDFKNCEPDKRKDSLSLDDLLDEYIKKAGKPALKGFYIGHSSPSLALPVGSMGRIDTYRKSFTVESGIKEEVESL